LPEGGYPEFLSEDDPLFNEDRVRECGNRCRAAAALDSYYSTSSFYVLYGGQCACSTGDCSTLVPSGNGYFSYSMEDIILAAVIYT